MAILVIVSKAKAFAVRYKLVLACLFIVIAFSSVIFFGKKESFDQSPEQTPNYIPSNGISFDQSRETFFPEYEKELNLFNELSPEEQQEYLSMDKDLKFANYGDRLR